MNNITKEQFDEYEACRESGVTNMFDVRTVMQITGLEKETILIIMKHYSELKAKYE